MTKKCPIKRRVLALFNTHKIRLTPTTLESELSRQMPGHSRKALRNAIKAMVSEGSLVYTNHYSTTHLELNFNQPVRVSDRITLCPANCSSTNSNHSICIKLEHGTSFGIGDHPTTRLCIQGLDATLDKQVGGQNVAGMRALDIGTGSAVLAMAAVGLGVGRAVGIDIDPLACSEARKNLALNGMANCITIHNQSLDSYENGFHDIILANLRPPTLKVIFPIMENISACKVIWVLSGFRPEEEKGVVAQFPSKSAEVIWRSQEQGWSGLVVKLNL